VVRLNCSYFLSNYINYDIFIILSFFILALLTVYFLFIERVKGWGRVGMVLILAGGTLNLLERAINSCVKDYINFFGLFYYNVFDALVTLGLAIFIYFYIRKHGR